MVKKIANTDLLDGVAVFVGVIEAGSFTAAAELLGRSTSYVSKEITRLEKRLKSRLLNRTTRRISLTDAGKAYYERCHQIVIDAENAERSINLLQDTPRGLLRVNAPLSFGLNYLCDYLPEFMHKYSEVNLEVEFNDRMIDVVAEGYDVVIRAEAGEIKDSNLIARKLMTSKSATVASPDFLQQQGRPILASDLDQYDTVTYSLMQNPLVWKFSKDGIDTRVDITPRLICNNAELELTMVKKGVGITRLPLFSCEKAIAAGELETILDDYDNLDIGIYAIYPHRQYLTAKVRVFVDFMVEKFK